MTDEVKVLSDDALREIEARANAATEGPWSAYHRISPRGAYKQWHIGNKEGLCQITMHGHQRDYEFMAHAREDIPALCATVRALRQVNERLSTGLMNIHHVITNGPCERAVALGMATSAVSSLLNQNTALREQLAETQRAVDHWVIMYNKVSSDNTELVNQQGRPDVKRAAEIVSDAIRNSGFTDNKPSARSWAEGGESVVITQLQSQLAQVTQERVKLTAQEIKVLTDYHYYEAEKNITRLGCRKGQRSHLERLKVIQDSATALRRSNHEQPQH